jgi:dihydroorotate dehydrogenase electron transfer subunit
VIFQTASVVANTSLGPGHFELVLEFGKPLPSIAAGQFLNLQCDPGDLSSMLRPFSVLWDEAADGRVGVYYKVLGRMSELLTHVQPGEALRCLIPLGQAWPFDPAWRRVALLGGGVGIAPLLYYQQQHAQSHPRLELRGYFGGRSAPDLVPELLSRYSFTQHLSTDDGSAGYRGNVIALFREVGETYDAILTCGPNAMMAALKGALPPGVPAYASLEEYMACGVGACYGCTALLVESGAERRQTVCKDGPVFDLRQVVFET